VVDAGARFVVSPGIDDGVLAAAREAGVLAMPGALTPTEVMRAVSLGAQAVKLFPASIGGPAMLRALREPFPDCAFVPTGGVSAENVGEWFEAGAHAVGAGSSLCPTAEIAAGRFDAISDRAERFAAAAGRRS
jgi:2-dehydro-3-deoxyphosphogluconate aldolase/(4S)-4-hydroxy-2-oxoglutarate aldolase